MECAQHMGSRRAQNWCKTKTSLCSCLWATRHRARANLHKVVQVRESRERASQRTREQEREREREEGGGWGAWADRELVWTAECAARDGAGGSVCGACQRVRVRARQRHSRRGFSPAAPPPPLRCIGTRIGTGQDADAHRTCWAMCCGCRCCWLYYGALQRCPFSRRLRVPPAASGKFQQQQQQQQGPSTHCTGRDLARLLRHSFHQTAKISRIFRSFLIISLPN